MKRLFVTIEICALLKKLGYDEPCMAYYTDKGKLNRYINLDKDIDDLDAQTLKNSKITMPNYFSAPTYQQVEDYLREVHDVKIDVSWVDYYSCYEEEVKSKLNALLA